MIIAIISASIRPGRRSHRLAMYFQNYIIDNQLATVELLDLKVYAFPLFGGRVSDIENPPIAVWEFADKIKTADGVIIVTPEYNGGYPASLKNALDLLLAEWKRKPIAIATAVNGIFGGAQVTTALVFSLWKMGACLAPASFAVPKVHEALSEEGIAIDKTMDERAKIFTGELLWMMKAFEGTLH